MTNFKRFLVILLSFSICWIAQMILIPQISFLVACPNLLLAEVVSAGFLFGKTAGLFTGVAAGLFMDILGIGIPGYYTLILSVLGFLNGLLAEKIDSELVLVLLSVFLINECFFHVYNWSLGHLFGLSVPLRTYLGEKFLPELLLSSVCFLVFYGILLLVCNQWDLKLNKGEIKVV